MPVMKSPPICKSRMFTIKFEFAFYCKFFYTNILEFWSGAWRIDLVAKNSICSCGECRFTSQHSHDSSQWHIAAVVRGLRQLFILFSKFYCIFCEQQHLFEHYVNFIKRVWYKVKWFKEICVSHGNSIQSIWSILLSLSCIKTAVSSNV